MIIIDFIDMISRADKIAILEELEMAVETDKAKPQVGQLSDLGLVEMTRHRQGQSLAEIFTKKCTHCNGTGQILDDFGFATALAEGEQRSRAAKLKLPMNSKNLHNDKNNKVFNHQTTHSNQPKNDYDRRNHKQDEFVEIENQENRQEQPRKNNKNNRYKNRKNNIQNRKEETKELIAQVSEILENADVQPVENAVVEQVVEPHVIEVQAEEKPVKPTKKRTTRKTKKSDDSTDNNIETSIPAEVEPVQTEQAEEKSVKKTKTRKASRARKKTTTTEVNEG